MAVITVSQLNNYMKRYIDNNVHLAKLWVKGELSNFKRHYTGHIYMTLKDEGSAIRAVMFKGNALSLKFLPDNGMKVIACGRVSVYERDGQYQLYVESMVPDGVGELHIAYEQLKKRLEAEGLFSPDAKKAIPQYPHAIGVVTSPTGAAIRDIINILSRRYQAADIYLYPALVQGEGAAESIVKGLAFFNREKNVDVIIVGRGGGSIEDLWAFNEEIVARAIYQSNIPVISAVGHETDFTIADFVADLRAPTPSAAAELAVPSALELKNSLAVSQARLSVLLTRLYEMKKQKLELLRSSRVMTHFPTVIDEKRMYLDTLLRQMEIVYEKNVTGQKHRLGTTIAQLEAINPLAVLRRGFALAEANGRPVKSVNTVMPGDSLDVRLQDGRIQCMAKRIVRGDENAKDETNL